MGKRETRQVQVAVRFTPEMLAAIDDYTEQLQAELEASHPGMTATRADAVRVLVAKGLDSATKKPTRR